MKTVKQLMAERTTPLRMIGPNDRVIDALRAMAEYNVGALLVTDGGKLVGIISERDYARKVILHGKSSEVLLVKEIMTTQVTVARPDQTVDQCMSLMSVGRFRHLPVVDGERLVGILSIGDLVKEVILAQAETIQQLQSYIHS